MAAKGRNRQLYLKLLFQVHIRGIQSAAFRSISGLKATVGVAEYWEGGSFAAFKEAGRVTFDNLTLERGTSDNEDFHNWSKRVVDMTKRDGYGGGDISPQYKEDGEIHQLKRDGSLAIVYPFFDAFPVEYMAGEWNNDTDEVAIESMVLAYYYFDRETISTQSIG